MNIVITGVGGFVGHHLVRELRKNNINIIGVTHESDDISQIDDMLEGCYRADLSKEWPNINEPVDAIIHLAGLAAVGPSFDNPQLYLDANSAMMTNMAEYYLKQTGKKPRFIVISSGAVYSPNQDMPLDEVAKIGFSSPYVLSKVLLENQCTYYRERGLDCVVVRPFNHIGPGQKLGFLVPDLIEQLQTLGDDGVIKVGNLETKRDYTDVRDVARAYRLLATAPNLKHTIYNVCSGRSVAGTEMLTMLQKIMDKDDAAIEVDKNKFRPTDAIDIYGDNSTLKNDTGWQPEITTSQTLQDSVDAT